MPGRYEEGWPKFLFCVYNPVTYITHMLKEKLVTIYIFLQTLLCGCSQDRHRADFEVAENDYKIEKIGKMDKHDVKESSGFELADDGNLWTHADGGNAPVLYKVTPAGQLLQTLEIPNTTNLDWEDLTRDDQGYIYIGDFGNNQNRRKNLRIFRVKENDVSQIDTISFSYADQTAFPPSKADWNFDCEAFFYFKGNLYLFSKNRGTNGQVKMYQIPAKPGTYRAEAADSLAIASRITAADISPDGQTMVLLGYGNLYIFNNKGSDHFFDSPKTCIPIAKSGQAEALVFLNNRDFVYSNEGGKIFKASRQ